MQRSRDKRLSAVQLQRLFELRPENHRWTSENLLLEFIAGVVFFKVSAAGVRRQTHGQAADNTAEGCADGGSDARKDGTDGRTAGCACRSAAADAGGFTQRRL